jgi:cytochrome b561
MTQNDRFFIPTNIAKVSEICDIVEIVDVNSKYSLDNQISNYFKWFGLFQCAKMGLVTIGREIQKYLDRVQLKMLQKHFKSGIALLQTATTRNM